MISSRTPGGSAPNRCPVCGAKLRVEPALLHGDAPCPTCGTLLWFLALPGATRYFDQADAVKFRERVADFLATRAGLRKDDVWSRETGADSLDIVELVMELEDELGFDFGE
jgi:acyl carrier protein